MLIIFRRRQRTAGQLFHEVIDDFNRFYFRFLVNDYLANERAQYFGRECFKITVLVDEHHKAE